MNIDKSIKNIIGNNKKNNSMFNNNFKFPNLKINSKLVFSKNNFNNKLVFLKNTFKTNNNWMNRKIKPNRMNRKNDWDGDGIINKLDCQPYNVMRQDAKLNPLMRKRVEQLPINVVTYFDEETKEVKSIPLSEYKGYSRQQIENLFKKYPELMSEVREHNTPIYFHPTEFVQKKTEGQRELVGITIPETTEGTPYKPAGMIKGSKVHISGSRVWPAEEKARILTHELQHIKQMEGTSWKEHDIKFEEEHEKYEEEARLKEIQLQQEHEVQRNISKQQIAKAFRQTFQ